VYVNAKKTSSVLADFREIFEKSFKDLQCVQKTAYAQRIPIRQQGTDEPPHQSGDKPE
jgi:hypothetical protein